MSHLNGDTHQQKILKQTFVAVSVLNGELSTQLLCPQNKQVVKRNYSNRETDSKKKSLIEVPITAAKIGKKNGSTFTLCFC